MAVEQYSLVANDWLNLEAIINDLTQRVVGQELHPTSTPTFDDLTLTGDLDITGDLNITGNVDVVGDLDVDGTITFNDLTASRIVATNASKELVSLASPLIVSEGGTGAATLTDGGVLLGSGTGAITAMAVLADGEFIVGDGTTDPVAESGNTARTSLGLGTGDSPQFTGVELGHATDTTITRVSAGIIAVEGTNVMLVGDAPTAHTHDTDTLQHDGVNSDGGAFSFTTTGTVTFNQSITSANYTAANLLTAAANNAGELDFTAASKKLDVEDNAVVSQDYSSDATPQWAGIELGHASDTTLTRVSAGIVAIEGTNIAMVGGAHHDGFSDFVANEHIDHTSVTLIAGTGLTGGGDISSNRTFAVDGLLEDLDTLGASTTDGEFLVATGAGTLAWETGATARTSIGLGTGDSPTFTNLTLTGTIDVDGISDLDDVDIDGTVGINTPPLVTTALAANLAYASAVAQANGIVSTITSTHTSGTISGLYGYFGGASANSNSAVTSIVGVSGEGSSAGTNTPSIVIMNGVQGVVTARDSAVTYGLSVWGQVPTVVAGSIGDAVCGYFENPTVGTRNWSGLFTGDVGIAADKKLLFESALGVGLGDTYLVYDSAGVTLDCFVNATEVWNSSSAVFSVPVTARFGGASGYLQVDSDGDTRFFSGGGLPFGSCWGNEIAWTQAAAVQNTWYEISDADMSDGQLHDITHDGSGKLTVTYAGMYLCTWTLSGETSAGSGTHIQGTFSISGTETNDGMNHSETIGANSQIAMAGTAILDLAASATLEVSIRTTDAGTPNITVDHLNITCVQIGGT
jgi:hypothetical protein